MVLTFFFFFLLELYFLCFDSSHETALQVYHIVKFNSLLDYWSPILQRLSVCRKTDLTMDRFIILNPLG